jgi:hypothetical protein
LHQNKKVSIFTVKEAIKKLLGDETYGKLIVDRKIIRYLIKYLEFVLLALI